MLLMEVFRPLFWRDGGLMLLDQRRLPAQEIWLRLATAEEVARAIRDMAVRGAPAIGTAAAFGMALSMRGEGKDPRSRFEAAAAQIGSSRPTARDLFAALERMETCFASVCHLPEAMIEDALVAEANALAEEGLAACRAIGRFGAELLQTGTTVLTHCNAGALATAGYGTALGVIRGAIEAGKKIRVLAGETRPFLQGARLTAWELEREGIDVTLITDSMAGHFLSRGEISAIVVGADRIAASGDAANKIGTYALAVLAREHRVPFYVAAPTTTLDLAISDGTQIPIEERSPEEVLTLGGFRIAPDGVPARHPAFDVTPARLITAIITEQGIHRPPYEQSLPRSALRSKP
jgi:methylthioribose-1-phosphate isomerase